MPTLTFATLVHAVLFNNELSGQLSDGMWENTRPHDHWKVWCRCDVKVGPTVGRDFSAIKDNYNLNSSLLLECVGNRMVAHARFARAIEKLAPEGSTTDEMLKMASDNQWTIKDFEKRPEGPSNDYWDKKRAEWDALAQTGVFEEMKKDAYGMKELRKDLAQMKKVLKTRV